MQSKVYYKFTRDNEKNGEYQYVDGINRIDENDSLNNKKLFCYGITNVFSFLFAGAKYVREVKVEKDWIISYSKTITDCFYAKKMIFTTRLDLTDISTFTYLFNKLTKTYSQDNLTLKWARVLEWACGEGHIDIVKHIFPYQS